MAWYFFLWVVGGRWEEKQTIIRELGTLLVVRRKRQEEDMGSVL